jgi:homoserine dehydrogenase
MKSVVLAFLGFGVVGSKLMEYVRGSLDELEGKRKCRVLVDKVFVRDIMKTRGQDTAGLRLTDNPYEAIRDADIVIDCMGGGAAELTRKLVLEALSRKKAVIMSSKKCLALYGKEITEAAAQKKACFRYDATVGGGIPISTVLEHMGKCETIQKIYGICNGTSNYILNEMQYYGTSYHEALRSAQQKGYAENDPRDDVDGHDAMYKAVILTGFGMGHWMDCRSIKPKSIADITAGDLRAAKLQECIYKPVFSIMNNNGQYECAVGPQPVALASILAPVNENNNIIVISTSESGERAFYGQGAGAKPTASAMYDDLVRTLCEFR